MSSTAFTQAFEYLETGIKLLSNDCWNTPCDLWLELYEAAAKASYCISNYAVMDNIIDSICKHAVSSLHMAQLYSLKIKHFNDNRQFEDAVTTAVHLLDMLDEKNC